MFICIRLALSIRIYLYFWNILEFLYLYKSYTQLNLEVSYVFNLLSNTMDICNACSTNNSYI